MTAAAGATGLALWVALRGPAPGATGGWPGAAAGPLGGPALLAGLVGAAVLAQQIPLTVGPQQKYTLAVAVAFAAVLLLPPALAVLVVALGQLLGQGALALRRLLQGTRVTLRVTIPIGTGSVFPTRLIVSDGLNGTGTRYAEVYGQSGEELVARFTLPAA